MSELARWDSFYMIVGPAAGALIGLQFVVLTLIAARPPQSGGDGGAAGAAFATPTIVHFSVILFLSALLRAPWNRMAPPAILSGLAGIGGTIYVVLTILRMNKQRAYTPEFEDWLFHGILPLAAYLLLAAGAFATVSHEHDALFAVGAAVLLLLFIGIHNAWDGILYHVFTRIVASDKK
ncbi:MAG TPA: hypothetical protein VGK90_12825 [Rhizomicrobium sp.]|jgi:hypothetical protein